MRTVRCKCGESIIHTSMGITDCETCDKCGSTFAGHPDGHAEPIPHDWQTKYDSDTGQPYLVCGRCGKSQKQKTQP